MPVKNDAARLERCLERSRGTRRPGTPSRSSSPTTGRPTARRTSRQPPARACFGCRGCASPNCETGRREAATARLLAFVDADHVIAGSPGSRAPLDVMAEEHVGAAGALYSAPPDGTWVQQAVWRLAGPDRRAGGRDLARLGQHRRPPRRLRGGAGLRRARSRPARTSTSVSVFAPRAGESSPTSGWPASTSATRRRSRALFRAERWRGRDNLQGEPARPADRARPAERASSRCSISRRSAMALWARRSRWPVAGARVALQRAGGAWPRWAWRPCGSPARLLTRTISLAAAVLAHAFARRADLGPGARARARLARRRTTARPETASALGRRAHMTAPIRVLELRSVWGTGGGPDKTILTGAQLSDPDIARHRLLHPRRAATASSASTGRAASSASTTSRSSSGTRSIPRSGGAPRARARSADRHRPRARLQDRTFWPRRWQARTDRAAVHGARLDGPQLERATIYYPVDKRLLAQIPAVDRGVAANQERAGRRRRRRTTGSTSC